MASTIGAQPGDKAALTPQVRVRRVFERVLPWAAFAAFMLWAWGPRDMVHAISNYGDAFENIVTSTWFGDALATGQNPLLYPFNYFPEGWHVGSHSISSLLYLMLAPLMRLAGGALAYNLVVLLNCVLGFTGALLLARRHLSVALATLIALAIAFWSLRWSEVQDGRLNILLASSTLPWMLWGAEKALSASTRGLRVAWLVFVGVCWAFTLNLTLYFIFIGGILLAAWMLPAKGSGVEPWQRRLLALTFVVLVLMIFSAPWLALNLRESAAVETPFYDIAEVNFSGASLNSLPVWFLNHPWLGSLARTLYRGEPWEQGMANLGVGWVILAFLGVVLGRRNRVWLPALILSAIGLVFTLGLTLHWNGQTVQWPLLRPLNLAIWHLGHAIKPGFFPTAEPPAPFADAIPLPGLLLSTFVPFLERGRMFVRYALAANLGVLMLAGVALYEVGRRWPQRPHLARATQWALAILLLIEIVPPRLPTLPFPPPAHPAYTWLSQQSLGDQGIATVFAARPSILVLSNHGYNLLAVDYHRQPTVEGAAGVKPKQNSVLNEWLATHEHPFWNPDFGRIMRSYRVRYLLLEMQGDWENGLWQELQSAKEIKPVECFPPPEGDSPWTWPICVAEVLPDQYPSFNVLLHEGWSGIEEWGVWAEGTESRAQFVLTHRSPVRLELGVFPLCVAGKPQQVWIDVNGVESASYKWPDCEPWKTAIMIPADRVQVGFNDVTVRSAFAQPPADAADDDPRQLSVGLTRLQAIPQP